MYTVDFFKPYANFGAKRSFEAAVPLFLLLETRALQAGKKKGDIAKV